MALNILTSSSTLLLLLTALRPAIQADSSGLLSGASANKLQYITYIEKASGGSNPEFVYGTSRTQEMQNYLYTCADAVAPLDTGTVYSQYNASGEASIDRFVPDSNSSVLPYPLISVNASPAPQGYTVAFAKANASTIRLRNSDPLIGGICQALSAAISTVEPQKKALQKVTAVGEKDGTDIDGKACETYFAVESWGTPNAKTLNGSCTQWIGDLVSWSNNIDDRHTRGWVRMVGQGPMLARLIMAVKPGVSHL